MEYVKRKEALEILGICYKTLYKMAENKEIENKLVAKQLVQKFELKKQVFEQEKYLLEAQLKAIQMQLSNKNAELIVSIEEEEERIKLLLERQKFMKELREAHR